MHGLCCRATRGWEAGPDRQPDSGDPGRLLADDRASQAALRRGESGGGAAAQAAGRDLRRRVLGAPSRGGLLAGAGRAHPLDQALSGCEGAGAGAAGVADDCTQGSGKNELCPKLKQHCRLPTQDNAKLSSCLDLSASLSRPHDAQQPVPLVCMGETNKHLIREAYQPL